MHPQRLDKDFHETFHESGMDAILSRPMLAKFRAEFVRFLLNSGQFSKATEVLSLGCGNGLVEGQLAPSVKRIHGIDAAEQAVAQARTRFGAISNLTFEAKNLGSEKAFLLPESYDVVLATSYLHHISDEAIQQQLKMAVRVLKPGGVFISLDPSSQRLIRHFKFLVRETFDRYHSDCERELNPLQLQKWMAQAGLEMVSHTWFDFCFQAQGYLFPSLPAWVAKGLWQLDQFCVHVPGLRLLASSFIVQARKAPAKK